MRLIPFALGSLIGTSALNCFSTLPQLNQIGVITFSIMTLAILFLFVNKQKFMRLSVGAIAVAVGFSWAYYHAGQKLTWKLPPQTQAVSLCGTVTGVIQRLENAISFDIKLNAYDGLKNLPAVKMRLYFKGNIAFADNDKLCCLVKLKPNWHLSNPGGVDQAKQLFIEGIAATGKVIRIDEYEPATKSSIHRWRQRLNDRLKDLIGDKPYLGVIQATTLGIYHNIPPMQWQLFLATGTVHAIAISGMHISFVALLCGGWVTLLVKRFPKLTNRMPAKCYGAIFALAGALIYAALAGFSIPTQRALIMILVGIYALLKRQPILSWHALGLAWIGIFIVDPLAVLQIGFWLSFACVAALIFGSSHTVGRPWRKWIMPQWIVFIGLLPGSLFLFHQIPLLSPFANMVVLPLIDFLVVPACLLGLLLSSVSEKLAKVVLVFAEYLLEIIGSILTQFSNVSFNLWQQGEVPWIYLLLAIFAGIFILAPKGLPGRQWVWLGFLPMFFYQGQHPAYGEYDFTLLDVGQGLAAVIHTRHHTLLYDAGPQYGKKTDAGSRVIVPFLLTQHIKILDKVIISHADLDHRGGLRALADWPIEEILSSEPHRLERKSRQCAQGEQWEWDGVIFTLLNPNLTIDESASIYKKRNNLSCVLKVSNGDKSVLLTGDIEKGAEQLLLKRFKQDLSSTILVVPHHGSLTSSSQEFIEAVNPQYALFPVGMANRYGFPKEAVLKRYEAMGIKNLLVSQTGALKFRLKRMQDLTPPTHWRDTVRRYWHS